MKPTLIDKPNQYPLQELLVKFNSGVPLSADQLNFIYRHEKALSHYGHDQLLNYYLKPLHKKAFEHHSFLLHEDEINNQNAKDLKRRLDLLVANKPARERVQFRITPKQFLELRNAAVQSLILYHGNQFLTGAPFHLGGIPHVVFFRWGNLFGVAKYAVLAEEKSLSGNVLIYIENMQERNVQQCVEDFKKDFNKELRLTHHVTHTHKLEKQLPEENYLHTFSQTPKLKIS